MMFNQNSTFIFAYGLLKGEWGYLDICYPAESQQYPRSHSQLGYTCWKIQVCSILFKF